MFEYEVEITVEDKRGFERIIKRFYVAPVMGRYELQTVLEKKMKNDVEISEYTIKDYDVVNWEKI